LVPWRRWHKEDEYGHIVEYIDKVETEKGKNNKKERKKERKDRYEIFGSAKDRCHSIYRYTYLRFSQSLIDLT
jgi:hypothetical protein